MNNNPPIRKSLIIENALTTPEQEQLLDWLDSATYHQTRERLLKPRPDGFGLFQLKEDARDKRRLKVLEEKAASAAASSPEIPAEFEDAINLACSGPKQEPR